MRLRNILCTTAIVIALAAPAYASDSKLIDIINNNNQDVTTDSLNQAMLDLMQGRSTVPASSSDDEKKFCDPKNQSGPFDDPATEMNECDVANVAPAAGDDGGDESEPEDSTPNEDLSDPEPEKEDDCDGECGPPQEDPDQYIPEPPEPPEGNDCEGDCGSYDSTPELDFQPGSDTSLNLPTEDDIALA
jgi:hypothetical protein